MIFVIFNYVNFLNVVIFFFKGTDNVDVPFVDANESVKVGDEIQLLKNSDISNEDQNRRVIAGIVTSDLIEISYENLI